MTDWSKARRHLSKVDPVMKQIIRRTLAVHTLSAIVVWYGESRIGKTTTAEYTVAKILEAYDDDNPLARLR